MPLNETNFASLICCKKQWDCPSWAGRCLLNCHSFFYFIIFFLWPRATSKHKCWNCQDRERESTDNHLNCGGFRVWPFPGHDGRRCWRHFHRREDNLHGLFCVIAVCVVCNDIICIRIFMISPHKEHTSGLLQRRNKTFGKNYVTDWFCLL